MQTDVLLRRIEFFSVVFHSIEGKVTFKGTGFRSAEELMTTGR